MGEQYAWIVLFAIVVPTLFSVVKLTIDERRRSEELNRRLDVIEERLER